MENTLHLFRVYNSSRRDQWFAGHNYLMEATTKEEALEKAGFRNQDAFAECKDDDDNEICNYLYNN